MNILEYKALQRDHLLHSPGCKHDSSLELLIAHPFDIEYLMLNVSALWHGGFIEKDFDMVRIPYEYIDIYMNIDSQTE